MLGLIGALIGTWLSRVLHIPDFLYLQRIPVFWSIAGAAVFVALLNLLGGKRAKRN
ncbi:MAG: GlsB/YeaQ/YmgE family stress response membrane protein [bacterium]